MAIAVQFVFRFRPEKRGGWRMMQGYFLISHYELIFRGLGRSRFSGYLKPEERGAK